MVVTFLVLLFLYGAAYAMITRTKQGKMLGQALFALFVLSSLIPPWLTAALGEFWVQFAPADKQADRRKTLAKVVITVLAVCWRCALMLSCWIRIDMDGVDTLRRELGSTGKPVCVVANHCSFFDIFMAVTLQPLSKVGGFKMIVSSHVLKMPVIGRVATACGHLAVPFKDADGTSTNFEVDKDKLAIVMQDFEEHLKSGQCCSWFPEGTVNKGDCAKVQQIRAGGLGIAVRNDAEIWVCTFVGNAISWPKNAPIGGIPAHIGVRAFCLCKSSKELLADPKSGDDERSRCIFLADLLQSKMQSVIDEFVGKGYKAGNNERKKEAIKKED
jgi:1-acyl-sn-glycerol-3-phosphate acyltransferase